MAASRFLGIDIGDSNIRIAEFASDGKGDIRLVNFGAASLGVDPASEEDRTPAIAQCLNKLLAEKKFRAKRVALVLSGQIALTRFIKLPTAGEAKIRQMVRYEAEQNVPFPIAEVVWDHQVIGERGEENLEVVMVAIKKDIIEGVNKAIEDAGLSLDVVDIAPLAIYNAARYSYQDQTQEDSILILDIGARTTHLVFVEGGKVFSRGVPIAGNTITQNIAQEMEVPFNEAEKLKVEEGFVGLGGAYEEPESEVAANCSKIIRNVMTRLHAEVSRSINFYKTQQNGKAPKKLLLAGGTSIFPFMDHFFKEKMEIEVEYFNPFLNVPIDLPVEELEKVAHAMGQAVGSGLRMVSECPMEINLLPPTVIKRRAFIQKIPYFAASMLGVLLIFGIWWLYYWKITGVLSGHLGKIKDEVAALQTLDESLGKRQGDAAMVDLKNTEIAEIAHARFWWVDFLNDLNGRVPPQIWIVQMAPYSAGGAVAIGTGAAPSSSGGARHRGGPIRRGMGPMPGMPDMEGEAPHPEAQPSAGGARTINEMDIQGLCFYDWNAEEWLKPVTTFSDLLKQSPFIQEVKLMEPGSPEDGYWSFSFHLRVTLKQPIPF